MPQLDPVTHDQVVARLRQNEKPRVIAEVLSVGLSTVYHIAKAEGIGGIDSRMGRRRNTLTLPPATPANGKTVTLGLTDDEVAKLSKNPRVETLLVAGMVTADSLRTRILKAVGSDGPFKNTEELANTIRRKNDNFGYHEMTTILKHLKKQGLVSLKESKRVTPGATDSHPINIDLTLRGRESLGIVGRPLSERVLELICRDGGSGSNVRLAADLGSADSALRVDAALRLLNDQGWVSYKLGPNKTLVEIKPTEKGYEQAGFPVVGRSREGSRGQHAAGTSRAGHQVGKDMTEKRHHLPWASGGPIIRSMAADRPVEPIASAPETASEPVSAPAAPPVTRKGLYPLLEALVAEHDRVKENEGKALKLLEASELLADVDPEQAKILSDRAEAVIGRSFTPIEAEFLRYREEHP